MTQKKEDSQIRFDIDPDLKKRFKLALAKIAVNTKNDKLNQTSFLTAVIIDLCKSEGVL